MWKTQQHSRAPVLRATLLPSGTSLPAKIVDLLGVVMEAYTAIEDGGLEVRAGLGNKALTQTLEGSQYLT